MLGDGNPAGGSQSAPVQNEHTCAIVTPCFSVKQYHSYNVKAAGIDTLSVGIAGHMFCDHRSVCLSY